jgi:O-acetylhomoserine/O-acetylserine sulfhydrylase-like pyridoxal-dependent enzyme
VSPTGLPRLCPCGEVTWVSYPGLAAHPYHARANEYFRKDSHGAVLTFGVKAGDAGLRVQSSNFKL